MKIRRGFVTNSSSSSFILSSKLSKEEFLKFVNNCIKNYNEEVRDIFDVIIDYILQCKRNKVKTGIILDGLDKLPLDFSKEELENKSIWCNHEDLTKEDEYYINLIERYDILYTSKNEWNATKLDPDIDVIDLHNPTEFPYFMENIEETYEWYEGYCKIEDDLFYHFVDRTQEESLSKQQLKILKAITDCQGCKKYKKSRCPYKCIKKSISEVLNTKCSNLEKSNKIKGILKEAQGNYTSLLMGYGNYLIFCDESLPVNLSVPLSKIAILSNNHMG